MTYESLCPDCGRKHRVRNAKVPASPRQVEILRIIRMWRESFGYGPTLQDIADKLVISKVTAFEHIGKMKAAGLLIDRITPHAGKIADRFRRPANRQRRIRLYRRARTLDIAAGVLIPLEVA